MLVIEEVSELLKRKKLKIAVAESCTGGAISDAFTNISGASQFFVAGIVAYSRIAKEELLGVAPGTLEKYGAVSAEVATEMCLNIKKLTGADIGVSTTGYASGGGGIPEAKVGLAYVGIATGALHVFEKRFTGKRTEVKAAITDYTLEKLLEIIKKEF
ncbi:MAG: CinA family protein [Thermoplasmata archaeon]|nr:CinA family protein [Thermoplasmata archaeon]